MFKKFTTPMVLAAILLPSTALQAENHIYLGGTAGYLMGDSDRYLATQESDGALAGVNVGYEFAETWAIEYTGLTDVTGADMNMHSLSVYSFFGDRFDWSPYIVGGMTHTDPHRYISPVDNATSLHLGLGTAKYLSDRWELRADIRGYVSSDAELNPSHTLNETLFDIGAMLAINYHFGGHAKSASTTPVVASTPRSEPAPVAAEPVPAVVAVAAPAMKERTLELNVRFATDSDSALSFGDEVDQIGAAMQANSDLSLVLEGHTDSRGNAEYNKDLSQRRAGAVKTELVESYGISASRVTAIGYGEEQPIADNMYKDGRAKNRRVVGVLSWEEVVE